MSRRKDVAAHRAARAAAPPPKALRPWWRSWAGAAAGVGAILVVAGSFVVPGRVGGDPGAAQPDAVLGVERGAGLPVGSSVPSFRERDVETGQAITSSSLAGGRTLLFFSEGVMCQACFEQIKGLEQVGDELDARSIELVSITPDSPDDLRRAVSRYGITTPMISDEDGDMSEAFNTLGQGMHGNAPGHAFFLVGGGKVVWYRDYWLPPTSSMYVEPEQLLAALPA